MALPTASPAPPASPQLVWVGLIYVSCVKYIVSIYQYFSFSTDRECLCPAILPHSSSTTRISSQVLSGFEHIKSAKSWWVNDFSDNYASMFSKYKSCLVIICVILLLLILFTLLCHQTSFFIICNYLSLYIF